MKARILTYLRLIPAASAEMIAQEIDAPQIDVQAALHEMAEAGDVILRNGWYRLGAAARMRLGR